MPAATFYYDLSSPYAYLAATRIADLLPEATWRPIAFGIMIREVGKVPRSLQEGRESRIEEIQQRAAARGLPALRFPAGWPAESYSLAPLRALVAAEERGALQELTLELYRVLFGEGVALGDEQVLRAAASACGLGADEIATALDSPAAKERLRAYTDEALARGVTGVPTIAIGDQLFWGDDQLEEAARAAR